MQIDIRHHFVREKVDDGTIELIYCSTEAMVADVLTKGLSSVKFETLRIDDGLCHLNPHSFYTQVRRSVGNVHFLTFL